LLNASDAIPGYSGFRGGHAGQVYNEAAFRHFLAVDWWRATRMRRPLLLVLVTVRQRSGLSVKLTDATAAALFGGLVTCVREVDFVGWYREGHVAAAVLAQGNKASGDARQLIAERIQQALRERLLPDDAGNLRVRVVRLDGSVRKRSSNGV
jgi:hypothetical protein